jgi:hypothetical protein
MTDCRPMSIPLVTNQRKIDTSSFETVDPTIYHHLIGLLMYMVNTRHNINFAVNSLSQFMVDPRRVHWIAAKHVLHYLRGTMEYMLLYECSGGVRLACFTNAYWAGCVEDMMCCFNIGSCIISWFNRKQRSMALSFVEAEYMATSLATCKALWLRKFFLGLFDKELEATVIHYDNQSYIRLFKNPVFHDHSKNIDIHYHFIQDYVHSGATRIQYI